MNKLQTYLGIFCCLVFSLMASVSYGDDSEASEDVQTPSAADVEMDDGTNMEGDLIIPKKMAMRCGISSKDGRDKEKIQACLDTLASEGLDIVGIEQEMMHQLSKNAMEKALTTKSAAGNYEATRDDKLGEGVGVQAGSAAAGGEAGADGSDLRSKQEKNVKMSERGNQNLLKVIDIYSARVNLDSMAAFFKLDASYRQSVLAEEEED